MLIRRGMSVLALAGGLGLVCGSAQGGLDGGDIGLAIEGGQITTFLISESGAPDEPSRLFEAELGESEYEDAEGGDPTSGGSDVFQFSAPFSVDSFVTNVPGFDSGAGVFDPAATVSFEILSFTVYDPSSDSFIATTRTGTRGGSVVEALGATFQADSVLSNAGGPGLDPGLVSTTLPELAVFPNGRYHRHFLFSLLPADNTDPANPLPLADPGVYLLTLTVRTSEAGVAESEPFGILFAFDVGEAEEEAADEAAERVLGIEDDCPGDVTGDGQVTLADFSEVLSNFGNSCVEP